MLGSVLLKTLRDRRRGFAWWTLGLAGLVALMVAVYPTVRDNPEMNRLVDEYPEALKAFIAFGGAIDYTSGAGYLGSELFSFMVRGTLDLLLSTPVTRRKVAVEKIGAMVLELAGLGAVLWAALWIGAMVVGMDDVSAAHLAAATAGAGLLALVFGAIAFLVGAATGHRALAIGLATAGAVAAYLVHGLAALVEVLEVPQKLSPFYHYAIGDPLRQGLALDHTVVLVAVALAVALAGVLAFERRDLASS